MSVSDVGIIQRKGVSPELLAVPPRCGGCHKADQHFEQRVVRSQDDGSFDCLRVRELVKSVHNAILVQMAEMTIL